MPPNEPPAHYGQAHPAEGPARGSEDIEMDMDMDMDLDSYMDIDTPPPHISRTASSSSTAPFASSSSTSRVTTSPPLPPAPKADNDVDAHRQTSAGHHHTPTAPTSTTPGNASRAAPFSFAPPTRPLSRAGDPAQNVGIDLPRITVEPFPTFGPFQTGRPRSRAGSAGVAAPHTAASEPQSVQGTVGPQIQGPADGARASSTVAAGTGGTSSGSEGAFAASVESVFARAIAGAVHQRMAEEGEASAAQVNGGNNAQGSNAASGQAGSMMLAFMPDGTIRPAVNLRALGVPSAFRAGVAQGQQTPFTFRVSPFGTTSTGNASTSAPAAPAPGTVTANANGTGNGTDNAPTSTNAVPLFGAAPPSQTIRREYTFHFGSDSAATTTSAPDGSADRPPSYDPSTTPNQPPATATGTRERGDNPPFRIVHALPLRSSDLARPSAPASTVSAPTAAAGDVASSSTTRPQILGSAPRVIDPGVTGPDSRQPTVFPLGFLPTAASGNTASVDAPHAPAFETREWRAIPLPTREAGGALDFGAANQGWENIVRLMPIPPGGPLPGEPFNPANFFIFGGSSRPSGPDPRVALDLMKGLRTMTIRLMRRLERVSRKERSMDEGSDEGWKCGVCLDGWEGAEEAYEDEATEAQDGSTRGVTSGQVSEPVAGPSTGAAAGHAAGPTAADKGKQKAEPAPIVSGNKERVGLDAKTDIKALPCNHFFHKECLEPWFQTKQTCPTCRFYLMPWARSYQRRRPATGAGGHSTAPSGPTPDGVPPWRRMPEQPNAAPASATGSSAEPNSEQASDPTTNNTSGAGSVAQSIGSYLARQVGSIFGAGPDSASGPGPSTGSAHANGTERPAALAGDRQQEERRIYETRSRTIRHNSVGATQRPPLARSDSSSASLEDDYPPGSPDYAGGVDDSMWDMLADGRVPVGTVNGDEHLLEGFEQHFAPLRRSQRLADARAQAPEQGSGASGASASASANGTLPVPGQRGSVISLFGSNLFSASPQPLPSDRLPSTANATDGSADQHDGLLRPPPQRQNATPAPSGGLPEARPTGLFGVRPPTDGQAHAPHHHHHVHRHHHHPTSTPAGSSSSTANWTRPEDLLAAATPDTAANDRTVVDDFSHLPPALAAELRRMNSRNSDTAATSLTNAGPGSPASIRSDVAVVGFPTIDDSISARRTAGESAGQNTAAQPHSSIFSFGEPLRAAPATSVPTANRQASNTPPVRRVELYSPYLSFSNNRPSTFGAGFAALAARDGIRSESLFPPVPPTAPTPNNPVRTAAAGSTFGSAALDQHSEDVLTVLTPIDDLGYPLPRPSAARNEAQSSVAPRSSAEAVFPSSTTDSAAFLRVLGGGPQPHDSVVDHFASSTALQAHRDTPAQSTTSSNIAFAGFRGTRNNTTFAGFGRTPSSAISAPSRSSPFGHTDQASSAARPSPSTTLFGNPTPPSTSLFGGANVSRPSGATAAGVAPGNPSTTPSIFGTGNAGALSTSQPSSFLFGTQAPEDADRVRSAPEHARTTFRFDQPTGAASTSTELSSFGVLGGFGPPALRDPRAGTSFGLGHLAQPNTQTVGTGLFGQPTTTAAAASVTGGFGVGQRASSSQPSTGLFGRHASSAVGQAPDGGFSFGAPQPTPAHRSSTSLFGMPATSISLPAGFSIGTAPPTGHSSYSLFGPSSATATSQPSSRSSNAPGTTLFNFGSSHTPFGHTGSGGPIHGTSGFGQPLFGSSGSSAAPIAAAGSSPSIFSFGQAVAADTSSSGSIFSRPVGDPTSRGVSNLFGPPGVRDGPHPDVPRPNPAFSFGGSAATSATADAARSDYTFSFGGPASTSVTADAPRSDYTFSFGGPASTSATADAPRSDDAFSFGGPASWSSIASQRAATDVPRPPYAFSFGATPASSSSSAVQSRTIPASGSLDNPRPANSSVFSMATARLTVPAGDVSRDENGRSITFEQHLERLRPRADPATTAPTAPAPATAPNAPHIQMIIEVAPNGVRAERPGFEGILDLLQNRAPPAGQIDRQAVRRNPKTTPLRTWLEKREQDLGWRCSMTECEVFPKDEASLDPKDTERAIREMGEAGLQLKCIPVYHSAETGQTDEGARSKGKGKARFDGPTNAKKKSRGATGAVPSDESPAGPSRSSPSKKHRVFHETSGERLACEHRFHPICIASCVQADEEDEDATRVGVICPRCQAKGWIDRAEVDEKTMEDGWMSAESCDHDWHD